jgi:uncharacterized protein YigA (DUF484 family)
MSGSPKFDDALRAEIMKRPDVILDDDDLMQALIAANDRSKGDNIVDLRSVAMDRMEARLDRLEDTHRSVIAAAYDNLAGTNQVHRAVLRVLDPVTFDAFLGNLGADVAEILRVDSVHLVLESGSAAAETAGRCDAMRVVEPGFVDAYLTLGRTVEPRPVSLRQIAQGPHVIYGEAADRIGSEACLRLDLGAGNPPGMLVLGAESPHHFTPQQGTDLLAFFGGVFERALRHWLA